MKGSLTIPPNKKLTREVASAISNIVSTTGSLCPRDVKTIDIQVKDVETGNMVTKTMSVQTIRTWVARNTNIIGTSKGFGDFIEESRNTYRKSKAIVKNSLMLQKARRNQVSMLDLDTASDGGFIGITSKRDPKTGKRIEVQRYKQRFIGTDPIKLKIKADQTMKVLERLDPAFKKEDSTTNNVSVTLSFMNLANKEQEMIKLGKLKTV